jgi:threonine dehydratase
MGAQVRLFSEDFDAAKDEARRFCVEHDAVFVEDGFEPAISEGAGSIAVELLREREAFDSLVVPLGNGALLAGMARWLKAHAPRTQVIGVCAQGADAMAASWRSGELVERDAVDTIADGIAIRRPVPEALADLRGLVDDVILVSDDAIRQAMRHLFAHAGLVSETAGAAGVAALIEHARFRGRRVATVLCGSNLTDAQRLALQENP